MKETTLSTKLTLHTLCQEYVAKCILTVRDAMHRLTMSSNEETKSSMGDKYETSKAMIQLEMEKHAVQLEHITKMQEVMNRIDAQKHSSVVESGSVVLTDQGNFYLAISAGELQTEDQKYIAISMASPLGTKLAGCKSGDVVEMNKRKYTIREVY